MSERPTVFCKDYLFVRKGWTEPWSSAKCRHSQAIWLSSNYLIDADGTQHKYASTMRGRGDECGPEGKLWVPYK